MTAGQLVAGMWVILWIMFVGLLIAAIGGSFRRGRYTEDEFDRTTIRGSGAIMLAVLLFMLWAGPRVLATWFVLLQYVRCLCRHSWPGASRRCSSKALVVGRLSLGGSLDRRPNAEQSAFRTGGALLGDSACGVGNS